MTFLRRGVVSNCWQTQLANGESIQNLIAEALRCNLPVIELRQGSMGNLERADGCPDIDRLTQLAVDFPEASFNLAVSVPFLQKMTAEQTAFVQLAVTGAAAVSGEQQPHLRLVDLETPFHFSTSVAITNLNNIGASLSAVNGRLSIEHSLQHWESLIQCLRSVRADPATSATVQLCLDPCNLVMTEPTIDLSAAIADLTADEVSMVHFKQSQDRRVQPDFAKGDVPWPAVIQQLQKINFHDAALLEIAASAGVREQIEAAWVYLKHCEAGSGA